MNVYVRALAAAVARAGVECDVYTRAVSRADAPVVEVEPGFRVLHVPAGRRAEVDKHELLDLVGPFTDAAEEIMRSRPPVDALHEIGRAHV